MKTEKEIDPKMHSAEHILNQTMVRMFDRGRSFSAHIEKKKSKCDYHFDRNLTSNEVNEIETKVNAVIIAQLNIKEEFLTESDAEQIYNLERLPEDAGDKIRIIRIGDYDACPCSGPHVANTKEIGEFKVVSTNYENGVMRLRFKLIN